MKGKSVYKWLIFRSFCLLKNKDDVGNTNNVNASWGRQFTWRTAKWDGRPGAIIKERIKNKKRKNKIYPIGKGPIVNLFLG